MSEFHDFKERLKFSQGIELSGDVLKYISRIVPRNTGVRKATVLEDKSGTDYWIERVGNPPISIDVKHRGFCPIEKFGSDDACIETTSVYKGAGPPWDEEERLKSKVGWTLDTTKRTDFIVYTWPKNKGVRFWVVPFLPLCAAARRNWRAWARKYEERSAKNNGYRTPSVYPPRQVIAKAIKQLMSGGVNDL